MNRNMIQQEMIKVRDEYIETIKRELMGPGSEFPVPSIERELISSSPNSRYTIGILFPKNSITMHDNNEQEIQADDETDDNNVDELPDIPSELIEGETIKSSSSITEDWDDNSDDNLDEEVGMASQFKPSSMGITFLVKGNCDSVYADVEFATYRKATVPECMIPFIPENPDEYTVPAEFMSTIAFDKEKSVLKLISQLTPKDVRTIFERDTLSPNDSQIYKPIAYRLADYLRSGYVRVPHTVKNVLLDFSKHDYIKREEAATLDETTAKLVGIRKEIAAGIWSVTIMLINDFSQEHETAEHCIFQSKITISSQNNSFRFEDIHADNNTDYFDEEEKSLELLYRKKKIYGTGLGTAVDWNIDINGNGEIWSDFFPIKEIPGMKFSLPQNTIITDEELSMKYLSDLDSSDKSIKIDSLTKLIDLYREWVDTLSSTAETLDKKYLSAAAKNISECKNAYNRMYKGIQVLVENESAYNAFLLANRAMFMQRIHIQKQESIKEDHYEKDERISDFLNNVDYYKENGSTCKWRPFQIAFLLMDIPSIVDCNSTDRDIVDLIWFPTGGGKTEAYLGLTAFTIFYRKLEHLPESNGTTVIMRYTLRLLAAQQFTRAATLICACEYIRQDSELKKRRRNRYPAYQLGTSPITIGLWIGGSHIPNKNDKASEHLTKLLNASNAFDLRNEKDKHNKFQVLKCPWCGTKMTRDVVAGKIVGKWGYNMRRGTHFYLFCPHESCDFTKELPIQIIDDELYDNPPTLLFGTVDKFAMLPWDSRCGAFFGTKSNNRAPELIIQDELHLISGALGTMVGLYETAIDAICSQKGIKPKIIASTATIRRAKEQCSVLYNRDVVQFPAPGLDADDSFFAREDTIDHSKGVFGRKYVGIMPSGKTKAMTEIRAASVMLQKIYTKTMPDEVKDKFWTLATYFNSLRDLGKAHTFVEDDIKDFIVRMANRMFENRRLIISPDELTSRVTTTELNETLDKLEKTEYTSSTNAKKRASDILLATNMISVGIDVARLNVMLMVGQPKLTSEYIQASSRVGRSYPGTVFIQYDATKSRDRSHYERFVAYHNSFYRFVEPTGATPFSKPARERALHAILISILRQQSGLSEDQNAELFDKTYFKDKIEKIKEFITKRVDDINKRVSLQGTEDISEISAEIEDFFNYWEQLADECKKTTNPKIPLYFGRRFLVNPPGESQKRLMRVFGSPGKDFDAKETLTSMRNVDTPVIGSIIVWEE